MKRVAIPIVLATIVGACATPPSPSATVPVQIRFAAEVNGAPFRCGQSYDNVGTTRSRITPSDLRLYVSDVALITRDGKAVPVALDQDGAWQYRDVALLDFEDGTGPCSVGTKAIHTAVTGKAPQGEYTGVRFAMAVPFALNHGDPTVAASPLNVTAMFWNWQGGYKFLKFDTGSTGRPATVSAPDPKGGHSASGFSVHVGSTLCASPGPTQAPSACQNPNRLTVTFDRFDPARQTVVVDIGRVLAGANLDVNAPNTAPGCMSFLKDADCPPVMRDLGLPYEGAPAGQQVLFSVR
jgi:uncharacterized repeat protein (TIGR04052 family)